MSSLVPYRIIKTLASVPAYFLSPVFILTVYVVDMAVIIRNQQTTDETLGNLVVIIHS